MYKFDLLILFIGLYFKNLIMGLYKNIFIKIFIEILFLIVILRNYINF